MAIAPISRLGRAWGFALGVGVVALLAAPLLFHAFYTTFQEYDDEGYLLISLRDYARGGILYDEVYSQYGPAYFQLVTPLFRVAGLSFTHTHGRALALGLVVATAIVSAVAIWRFSRHRLAALAGEVLVIQTLFVSRAEPLHPGAVLAILLAGLMLAASFLDGARWRQAAGVMGVLLAAMLLIKINVGLFAAVGVAGALATMGKHRLRGVNLVAIALLPVALMAARAGEPTVRAYIAVTLASVVGVIVVAAGAAPAARALSGWLPRIAVPGGLALAAVVAGEWARGTELRGLLDGILFAPLRHPGSFFVAPDLGAGAFVAAAAGLVGAFGFTWARRRGWTERFPGSAVTGAAQLLGGVVLWLGITYRLPMSPLALTPSLLWLALAGPRPESGSPGLRVLAMVAALQTLHAYPIAGTQVAWATFLAIPVGAVALTDGWRRLRTALVEGGAVDVARARVTGAVLAAALIALTASGAFATHLQLATAYEQGVPLGLPGAESIRVPAEQATLYQLLVGTLRARCRTFVTQPGLNSFYLFTGMEPPTRANTTVWMLLLSDAQQEQIVERLVDAPAPVCALRRQRRVYTTPLARYIEERFVTLYERDFFEFRVRREPGRAGPA
jgi:hypothetical protein